MSTLTRILMRRRTAAEWTALNEILMDGEIGIITDISPRTFKIGDGITTWAMLPLAVGGIPSVGYYGGITPDIEVGTPPSPRFYTAGEGTYSNLGGLVVPANRIGFIAWNGTAWSVQVLNLDLSAYAKVTELGLYQTKSEGATKSSIFSAYIDRSKQLSSTVQGGYGYDSTGSLIVNASSTVTEKVPIVVPSGGRYVTILGVNNNTVGGTTLRLMNASGSQIGSIAGNATNFVQDVDAPNNGYKVQITDVNTRFIALQAQTSNITVSNFAIWDGPFVRNEQKTLDPAGLLDYVRKADLITYQENLVKMLPTGFRYSGTNGSLSGGQNFTGTEKIHVVPGDVLYISINTLGSNTAIGALFNAAGVNIQSISKTALTAVPGVANAYTYTVPATPADAVDIYFFFITSEVNFSTFLIVRGATYSPAKIKSTLIPEGKTKLSEFVNDAGFAGNADLMQDFDTLVTNIYPGSLWGSGAATTLPGTNADYLAVNKITGNPGDTVAIQGVSSTVSTQPQAGRTWDASGAFVANVSPSAFVPILGGLKYTFPAGVYMVGFNFLNSVAPTPANINIQSGAVIRKKQIKSSLLPDVSYFETDAAALAWYNAGAVPKVYTSQDILIIIKSQSQLNGRLPIASVPLPSDFIANGNTIPGVMINNSVDNVSVFNDIHIYGTGNKEYSTNGTQWSPLILLLQRMISNYRAQSGNGTKNLYVVQTSLGGTSFDPVAGELGGGWNVDTDAINKVNASAVKLNVMSERRINAMMAAYPNLDPRLEIFAFGEGDRAPGAALKFLQNVKNSIMYDRGIVKKPMMPVILLGVNAASTQYNPLVEQAKADLMAAVPNVKYIPVTGSTTLDGIHWDLATATTLMNDVYNEILNNPITYKILA